MDLWRSFVLGFLQSSLDSLSNNLKEDEIVVMRMEFGDDNDFLEYLFEKLSLPVGIIRSFRIKQKRSLLYLVCGRQRGRAQQNS